VGLGRRSWCLGHADSPTEGCRQGGLGVPSPSARCASRRTVRRCSTRRTSRGSTRRGTRTGRCGLRPSAGRPRRHGCRAARAEAACSGAPRSGCGRTWRCGSDRALTRLAHSYAAEWAAQSGWQPPDLRPEVAGLRGQMRSGHRRVWVALPLSMFDETLIAEAGRRLSEAALKFE